MTTKQARIKVFGETRKIELLLFLISLITHAQSCSRYHGGLIATKQFPQNLESLQNWHVE